MVMTVTKMLLLVMAMRTEKFRTPDLSKPAQAPVWRMRDVVGAPST